MTEMDFSKNETLIKLEEILKSGSLFGYRWNSSADDFFSNTSPEDLAQAEASPGSEINYFNDIIICCQDWHNEGVSRMVRFELHLDYDQLELTTEMRNSFLSYSTASKSVFQ